MNHRSGESNLGKSDGCPTFAKAYVGPERWAQPNHRVCLIDQEIAYWLEKAFEKDLHRPTYALANVGHPSCFDGPALTKLHSPYCSMTPY